MAINSLIHDLLAERNLSDPYTIKSVPGIADNVILFEGMKKLEIMCRDKFNNQIKDFDN